MATPFYSHQRIGVCVISLCAITGIIAAVLGSAIRPYDYVRAEVSTVNQLKVPCFVVDLKRRDRYLESGYNPRLPQDNRDSYSSEWHGVRKQLQDAISRRWKHGVDGGDCFIPSDLEPDRFLSLEVANEGVLDENLLPIVHRIVANQNSAYSVDICDAWGFLKSKDGQPHPHFNIFVERERILVYTESASLLDRLGMKDAKPLVE